MGRRFWRCFWGSIEEVARIVVGAVVVTGKMPGFAGTLLAVPRAFTLRCKFPVVVGSCALVAGRSSVMDGIVGFVPSDANAIGKCET